MLRFNRISARGLLNITYIPLSFRLFALCIITNITSFLPIDENWNCKSIYIYLIALMRVLSWSELFRRTLCNLYVIVVSTLRRWVKSSPFRKLIFKAQIRVHNTTLLRSRRRRTYENPKAHVLRRYAAPPPKGHRSQSRRSVVQYRSAESGRILSRDGSRFLR